MPLAVVCTTAQTCNLPPRTEGILSKSCHCRYLKKALIAETLGLICLYDYVFTGPNRRVALRALFKVR